MDPAERDVGGAGCEPAEVHLSLEPLRLAGVDQDGKHEDTDENEDEDISRQDPETVVVWPHSPDPQVETPPPMPQEQEQHTDEESNTQPRDKGKQPERLNFAPAFPESDAGSSQTAPPIAPGIIPPVSTAGLAHGQPIPWELDPERPAQKLPIRFRDILGRSILIPWRRAKTWEGMKMTIDSHFLGPEGEHMDSMLTYSVANVRYNLLVSLPSSVEPPKRRSTSKNSGIHISNDNDNGGGSSSSSNDHHNNSNNTSNSNTPQPEPSSPPMRAMVILPEFWDDLIQPGSNVIMNLWPRAPRAMYDMQPPNNIPGLQPLGPGMGMNQGHMPPMAPPPPQPHFIRIVGVQKTRPKTKASTGRPRRRM